MEKIINKTTITYILMFTSFMILGIDFILYSNNLMDISTYGFNTIKYNLIWIGFTVSWILMNLLALYCIKNNKKRLITYSIFNLIWIVILFSQVCYAQAMGKYMIFADLFLAGEGMQYALSAFLNLNFGMVVSVFIAIMCNLIILKINKPTLNENTSIKKYKIIIFVMLILLSRGASYVLLGKAASPNSWQENYNAKNIYLSYTNPNTSAYLSGIYEYHFRAIYKHFYNLVTFDTKALETTVDDYNKIYGTSKLDNEYTGLFKDKNVIYIMMESIDTWVIDKETMPTLYQLQKTGLNFTNRYSPFFNGGQTINSEFALNSGMYAISNKDTIYDIDYIDYPYSLANILKKNGYSVNSFHANTGSFYNRDTFHKLLGYDKHYSLEDMQEEGFLNKNKNYFSDSIASSDDKVFNLMTNKEQKFMSFYTTYSAHLEYTKSNKVFRSIEHTIPSYKYEEEEYIYRTLAKDTDDFIKNLINKLEKNNLLDDTILVIASDHYVYGYSDTEYVAKKKGVNNNRKELQNTPFIIWSKDMEPQKIDTILDTADILPTVFNLLGIDYNPNNYMGTDVFSENHDNFVWFSDGQYIKGENCPLTNEAILTKTNYNIAKNRNILLTNYYGKE